MILVDTSIWVDHLRRTELNLVRLLQDGMVSIHPFIVGELACGNLTNREELIPLLKRLPSVVVADHHEAMAFLNAHRLWSRGIGYVDLHLLAAATLSGQRLWTRDKRLNLVADQLELTPND